MTLALQVALQTDEDYRLGDTHQAILNIGYNEWQKHDTWQYGDMVKWMKDTYGELAALAVLIGKYNQQVCNGGHSQYVFNGYADGTGGCFNDHSENIDQHKELVTLFEKDDFKKRFSSGDDVYEVISNFYIEVDTESEYTDRCSECGGDGEEIRECPECDGSGLIDDESHCTRCDGTGDLYVSCSCCGGAGDITYENDNKGEITNTAFLDHLDTQWYAISDQFIQEFNEYLTEKLS